ncbi:MAG: hypothetical protein HQL31_12775, partial [Planctomycetes bacterium]|nr:hypothetical protein [Planctomycetota bacterium]
CIIYYDAYRDAALALQAYHRARGTPTDIVSTEYIRKAYPIKPKTEYITGTYPTTVSAAWVAYWDSLRSDSQPSNILEPLDLLGFTSGAKSVTAETLGSSAADSPGIDSGPNDYTNEAGTITEYITFLGNPMQIMPAVGGRGSASSNSVTGSEGTDYYYSLRTSEDYLPDMGISRIMVTPTDPSQIQVVQFTTDVSYALLRISGFNYSASELLGQEIVFTILESETEGKGAATMNYSIKANTLTNASGVTTLVVTELNPSYEIATDNNVTVTGSYAGAYYVTVLDSFRDVENVARGAFAFFSGSDLRGAADFLAVGKLCVLLRSPSGVSAIGEARTKVTAVRYANKIQIKTDNVDIPWPDYDANKRYAIVSGEPGEAEPSVFIPSSWTALINGVREITLNAGDAATDLSDNETLTLYDYTGIDLTGGGTTVSYVSPGPFARPGDGDTLLSRLPASATLLYLVDAANAIVDKIIKWGEYVWAPTDGATPGVRDYFNRFLVAAAGDDSQWSLRREVHALDILNSVDSNSGAGSRSYLNGFHVTKAFQSNDGYVDADYPRPRLGTSNAVVDAFVPHTVGKGFVYLNGWWNGFFVSNTTQFGTTNDPELSIIIAADAAGYSDSMSEYNIVTLSDYMKTGHAAVNHIASSGYGGAIAFIGGHDTWNVKYWSTDNFDALWSNGYYSLGQIMSSDKHLAREAINAYISTNTPQLGALWKGSITGFLKKMQEGSGQTLAQIANSYIYDLELWGCLGDAALELPNHVFWNGTEVQKPVITLDPSNQRGYNSD